MSLLLFLPLIYHLINDRNGELPAQKSVDILVVSLIAIAAALLIHFYTDRNLFAALLLSWGIHFMVFDYAIVAILKKRGVLETKESWFTYLGKNYTDDVLRQFTPNTRFILKLIVLIVAIVIYYFV